MVALDGGRMNTCTCKLRDGVTLNATVGQPYGTLRGTDYVYLNGQPVVDADGYYEQASDKVIGNITPELDWWCIQQIYLQRCFTKFPYRC
jgi:hypothetical protein